MAKREMTIAEQLSRAAEALERIDKGKNTDSAARASAGSTSSPAPAGSLSAELLRDGFLRYGR